MTGTALTATAVGLSCRMTSGQQDSREGYLPLRGLAWASAEAATDFVLAEVRPSRSSADAFLATGRDVCFVFRVSMSLFTSCLSSLRHGYAFVKMNATRVKRPCKIEGTRVRCSPLWF